MFFRLSEFRNNYDCLKLKNIGTKLPFLVKTIQGNAGDMHKIIETRS